jgi:hypothetical protein
MGVATFMHCFVGFQPCAEGPADGGSLMLVRRVAGHACKSWAESFGRQPQMVEVSPLPYWDPPRDSWVAAQ